MRIQDQVECGGGASLHRFLLKALALLLKGLHPPGGQSSQWDLLATGRLGGRTMGGSPALVVFVFPFSSKLFLEATEAVYSHPELVSSSCVALIIRPHLHLGKKKVSV